MNVWVYIYAYNTSSEWSSMYMKNRFDISIFGARDKAEIYQSLQIYIVCYFINLLLAFYDCKVAMTCHAMTKAINLRRVVILYFTEISSAHSTAAM